MNKQEVSDFYNLLLNSHVSMVEFLNIYYKYQELKELVRVWESHTSKEQEEIYVELEGFIMIDGHYVKKEDYKSKASLLS